MWKIVFPFLLFLAQVVFAEENKCRCGIPSDNVVSMRIVGGRRAEPHSHPWAGAILKNDRMHCGGAIVTNRHILSAGHCFKWDDITDMIVLVGLDDMNNRSNVITRKISKAVVHENFKSTAVRDENDIAIATLNVPVKFSDYVIPICLPYSNQDFTHRVATIVGWGRQGVNEPSSKVLMKASLRILSDDECQESKLSEHIVSKTMMCAYQKGRDGCQGDSGGPLLAFEPNGHYVIAGVVSWGIGCADARYPGVYTKVSQYIDWIKKHTPDSETCNQV